MGNTTTDAIAFPAAAIRSALEAGHDPQLDRAKEVPAVSARESWTQRRAQRQEREEVAPGGALPHTKTMNALHRCDRCGAQACVRVLLHSRQDLLFCAHHYRQHAPALAKVARTVQDETQRLARDDWPGSRG